MFLCENYNIIRLPDLNMYGGDTTPWSVTLVRQNGNPYPYAAIDGCTCTLTLMPFSVSNGVNANVNLVPPVLTVVGTLTNDTMGTGTVVFHLTKEDTIALRGKYIYQVEIDNDGDLRIGQGFVTIRQNINRPE